LLRKVTTILRLELRGNDIIGRWGEASFIIMLPETPGKAAVPTFERIFKALEKPIELSQFGITINLSPHIGAAVYSDNISSMELIEKVELSLERSRSNKVIPFYLWEMANIFRAD
ncbi:MAG: diguanylate cyclase, partial [Anaerolineae bacterium]|nr:diguanylate cyclase [Anaerolineae bacterium]